MAKRRANKDLNHDNWDQEDSDDGEAVEEGFEAAPKEQIATRKIAVAKRRLPSSGSGTSGGALFAGFTGFGATASTSAQKTAETPKAPQFNFGANTFSTSTPLSTTEFSYKPHENGNGNKKTEQSSATAETTGSKKKKTATDGDEQYRADLKALNEGVVNWCQQHISENPFVDLSPVFKDYFTHIKQLDQQYLCVAVVQSKSTDQQPEKADKSKSGFSFGITSSNTASTTSDQPKPAAAASFGNFKFGAVEPTSTSSKTSVDGASNEAGSTSDQPKPAAATSFGNFKFGAVEPTSTSSNTSSNTSSKISLFGVSAEPKPPSSVSVPTFNFGQKSSSMPNSGSTAAAPPLSFNFGQQSTTGSGGGGLFSFGKTSDEAPKSSLYPSLPPNIDAPFSFKNTGATDGGAASAPSGGADDDDDAKPYEPPKVELVENEEPGAIFSIKCKMFFMKDGEYVEKGVGTLHLKPLEESSKTQILVRAATATGTVLLNVSLSSKMPTKRVGKNNVSLVCVPHPPLDPKESSSEPTTLLIRVKTGDDADKLLEKLEERKQMAD